MHLLVTDPATSPRKSFGKIVFGAGYGVAGFALYTLLARIGAPTFYDKLLCVPPLNLTVRALDRASLWLEQRIRIPSLPPRPANYAHMAVWVCLFVVIISTGFLEGRHPGASLEFWRKACADNRASACDSWVRLMSISCNHGSGGACMMLGVASAEGRTIPLNFAEAGKRFAHACEFGITPGCQALVQVVEFTRGRAFQKACDSGDGESCFLLDSLCSAGRGVPQDLPRAVDLFRRACSVGWDHGWGGLGECYRTGHGVSHDNAQALYNFDKACRNGITASCFSAAQMYRAQHNESAAQARLSKGCDISAAFTESNAAYFPQGSTVRPVGIPAECVQ